MADRKKAKLFRNGGSQAVRLPAEFRFEGDEITGDVILSSRPDRDAWKAFIAFRDALDRPPEADRYLAERPMNRPVSEQGVFEDEA